MSVCNNTSPPLRLGERVKTTLKRLESYAFASLEEDIIKQGSVRKCSSGPPASRVAPKHTQEMTVIENPVQRFTRNAAARLDQLNFDPLAELVELLADVKREIAELEALKLQVKVSAAGEVSRKYSPRTHLELIETRGKLTAELLRYGYARATETVIQQAPVSKGITINLTPKGVKFDPDSAVDFTPNVEDVEVISETLKE